MKHIVTSLSLAKFSPYQHTTLKRRDQRSWSPLLTICQFQLHWKDIGEVCQSASAGGSNEPKSDGFCIIPAIANYNVYCQQQTVDCRLVTHSLLLSVVRLMFTRTHVIYF